MFERGDLRHISLIPHKELNSLIYETFSMSNCAGVRPTNFKNSPVFGPPYTRSEFLFCFECVRLYYDYTTNVKELCAIWKQISHGFADICYGLL